MDSLGIKEGILLLKKLISTLKAGDYAIYLDYVILEQLILANNCPLYNTKNGYFRGVKKWLAYIMIRGDSDETFSLYGYDKERSKIMYWSLKHSLPNIFQSTVFKKHTKMSIKEKVTADLSKLFFSYLPLPIVKKKLTNFSTMFIFTRLIALMKILVIIL